MTDTLRRSTYAFAISMTLWFLYDFLTSWYIRTYMLEECRLAPVDAFPGIGLTGLVFAALWFLASIVVLRTCRFGWRASIAVPLVCWILYGWMKINVTIGFYGC